jgi:hypothetical protein
MVYRRLVRLIRNVSGVPSIHMRSGMRRRHPSHSAIPSTCASPKAFWGHGSLAALEAYYNLAQAVEASRRYSEHIRDLREGSFHIAEARRRGM